MTEREQVLRTARRWRRRIVALMEHAEDMGMATNALEVFGALLQDIDELGTQLTVCDWHPEEA
jgi:hypothetical protein